MAKTLNKKGYWTKIRVLETALQCKTPSEFWRDFRGAATAAKKAGYYVEATAHMIKVSRLPRNHYFDIDNIFRAYGSVKNRSELHQKYLGAINMAKKFGLHEMLISVIPVRVRQPELWSEKSVRAAAKNYKDVESFIKEQPGAYSAASKLGILSTLTRNMEKKGNLYKRFVYQIFDDTYYYVGITTNFDSRFSNHLLTSDPLRSKLFNSQSKKIVKSRLIDAKKAADLEEKLIRKHRKERKFIVLNKAKGGQLGSPGRTETLEQLVEKARGKTSAFLKKYNSGTYKTICRLPIEQKRLVRSVMKRSISEKIPDDKILEFCIGKTMAELREKYPGVRKRIYKHPDREKILKELNYKIRKPRSY